MYGYFKHFLYQKINHIYKWYWNFQRKILSSFKDISSYKFTKMRRDNGELPVYFHQVLKAPR